MSREAAGVKIQVTSPWQVVAARMPMTMAIVLRSRVRWKLSRTVLKPSGGGDFGA